MKRIVVWLVVIVSCLTANSVTMVELAKTGNNWKAEVQMIPPVSVDKVTVSNEVNSSDADFITNLDTSMYFLIDTSIPMKRAFRKGIRPLLAEMERIKDPKEQWIVAHFSRDINVIFDEEKGQSDPIEDSLAHIKKWGDRTELWRNVQTALNDLSKRSARRKIFVLLSDGNAEDTDAYTINETIRIAQKAHIRIVSLTYRDTIGSQNMRKLSDETGGLFKVADKKTYHFDSSLFRDLITLVRSQGIVTIPDSLVVPTLTGRIDLAIAFHSGEETRQTHITIDTDKIPEPKPEPEPEPESASTDVNKSMGEGAAVMADTETTPAAGPDVTPAPALVVEETPVEVNGSQEPNKINEAQEANETNETSITQEANTTQEVNGTDEANASALVAKTDGNATIAATKKNSVVTKIQTLYKQYTYYAWALGGVLLLMMLWFILRLFTKKKTPPPPPVEASPIMDKPQSVQPERTQTNLKEAHAEETHMAPAKVLAYFETLDGQRYDVFKFPSTIGKSSTNDVVVPGKFISRQHAVLTQKNNQYFILDNNSSNGVTINGRAIKAQEEIRDGSMIGLGPLELVFRVAGGRQAPLPHHATDEKTKFIR